jgi:hypothetical protein
MKTRKKIIKTKLNKRIHEYIYKQGDICCEEDYDRNVIIKEIIELYKEITTILNEKGVIYLEHVDNDITKFINYLSSLESNNNKEGIYLFNSLGKRLKKDKKFNEEEMIKLLHEVPLYYLLAFLGQVYHRRNQWKSIFKST